MNKIGVCSIGFISFAVYNCYKQQHNKELYNTVIHKNIGKIIAEFPSEYSNPKTYDKLYSPIKPYNGKSWIFDASDVNVVEGIRKLQEKYPDKNINIAETVLHPYNNVVVIHNAPNKIYIYLDNMDD